MNADPLWCRCIRDAYGALPRKPVELKTKIPEKTRLENKIHVQWFYSWYTSGAKHNGARMLYERIKTGTSARRI